MFPLDFFFFLQTCFEWFRIGLTDLEPEPQMQLFKEKLLKLDPTTLSPTGFECVKPFFESINMNNHCLKKTSSGLVSLEHEIRPNKCSKQNVQTQSIMIFNNWLVI